ncbi:MAG: MBL fold metallo-hydrolase [Alphaproteobacteria bacterium]
MQSINIAARLALAGFFAVSGVVAASAHETHQTAQAEDIQIGTTKLNDTLAVLSGINGFSGGNVIVSSGPDGMLIIDDKLQTMTEKLKAALDALGGRNTLRFVVNTHWHFDHAGGNAELGKSATIIAHTNVRKRLSTEQKLEAFGMSFPANPDSALPVITYDESASIHLNGEEVQLVHYPASHTDTDTVVYFTKSNVVHTGDLFFNGLFPFVDVENGGSVQGVARNVGRILTAFPDDVTIVPGHGPIATKADLRVYHRMLEDSLALVSDAIAAGKSLEEIQAAGVPEEWKSWAALIDEPTWLAIVHTSLSQ